MTSILSTKKLSPAQRQHLLRAGLAVVDLDFIKTEALTFSVDASVIKNALFTSQNAVRLVFDKGLKIQNCFCVGQRTEGLLKNLGANVLVSEKNGQTLGETIASNYKREHFHYFCAEKRLDTLPNILSRNNIKFTEIPVYKTIATPKKYEQLFSGVLFFSPSGVESYFSQNKAPDHSFCIGETTATALKKYTKHYSVAKQPTVENVLIRAIKHYKKHD